MTDISILQKSFKGWKIWVAISLGLLVAGWMVYKSVTEFPFLAVEKGHGNYTWIDYNKNGKVDFGNSKEFINPPMETIENKNYPIFYLQFLGQINPSFG